MTRHQGVEQPSLWDAQGEASGEGPKAFTGGVDLRSATSLLELMSTPGIGPAKAIAVARAMSSWDALSRASDAELISAGGKPATGLRDLKPGQQAVLPDGIRLVGYFDDEFPPSLRNTPSPPAVLWVRGTVPQNASIAVVGTREPTPYGRELAAEFAALAAEHSWGVISGLALGIDAEAHRASLDAGGLTWAYLGCGVDVPSPSVHRELASQIVAGGGGLLAEVPPGTEVSPRTLVARDRLQSGSSRATVIVQSGVPSGTLHTARFTLEQKRPLVVVEPPPSELGDPAWAANVALTNPAGCDPRILSATGGSAKRIAQRQPVADRVVRTTGDLAELLEEFAPS